MSNKLNSSNLNEGEFEVWNDIYSKKNNVQIAIYGSSRAWVHFNSKVIQNNLHLETYNFGLDGQNFDIQYLRHKEFFLFNLHPKIIILSLDVFTLEKKSALYNSDQFLPYMLFDTAYYNSLRNYKNFNIYDFILPSVRFFGKNYLFENLIYQSKYKLRNKGFKAQNRNWDIKNKIVASQYKVNISATLHSRFISFIQQMKKEGVKVVLVYSPEYIKGQKFVVNRKQIIELYQRISINQKLPFLDYSNHIISYHRENFYNSEHLNSLGVKKFNLIFTKDLMKYFY